MHSVLFFYAVHCFYCTKLYIFLKENFINIVEELKRGYFIVHKYTQMSANRAKSSVLICVYLWMNSYLLIHRSFAYVSYILHKEYTNIYSEITYDVKI